MGYVLRGQGQNVVDSSIAVFGPTDTGSVVPARTIAGPLTHLTGSGDHTIKGLATDTSGNLYVLCLCAQTGGGANFSVLEFSPQANGNVSPIRVITDPQMNPQVGNGGVAVDSAGEIYVSAATTTGTGAVFEFANSTSDIAAASNTVAVAYSNSPAKIAVH